MRIKVNAVAAKKVKGIPSARATVAGGEEGGARTVVVTQSALDAHDMPEVVCSLRMNLEEAEAHANRVLAEALREPELRYSEDALRVMHRAVDALRASPWKGDPRVLLDAPARDLEDVLAELLGEVRRHLPDPKAAAAVVALGALWVRAPWYLGGVRP